MRQLTHILILTAALLMTACDDFFDKRDDSQAIDEQRFFSDESAFRQAMTDAYIQLRDTTLYGGTLTLTLLEQAAGTLTPFDATTEVAAREGLTAPQVKARLDSTKTAAERVINACNHIVAAATPQQLKTDEVRMAVGEAYALRAALRFDLCRLQLVQDDVLPTVESDLSTAATLLRDSDPLVTTTSQTTVPVGRQDRRLRTMMFNWYAVKALQARIALWQGRYDDVLTAADSVMAPLETLAERYRVFYYMQPGKYGADFCFSREFLFGIATLPAGFPALSDRLFAELGVRTTSRLHTIYTDAADIRYRAWFRQSADGNGYTMARKFGSETLLSGYVVSATGSEMQLPASIPYIKIGEVALMAAEALNETGHPTEALTQIEQLRQTRGIETAPVQQTVAATADREAVRQLIMAERERELFGEGQLYYYYQRERK